MHKTSGRWQLGLMLSLTTAFMWGILPIALKGLLSTIDSYTITWYRFIVSVIFVAIVLFKRNRIPDFNWLKQKETLILFVIVIIGLSSNYILYLLGLNLVSPSAAQMVIQLAPMILLLGGIVVFKEKFSIKQWFGVGLFLFGLILFFNHRLETIFNNQSNYNIGIVLIVFAAIAWAAYALAQKQLLLTYGSQQIMLVTYVAASFLFFPSANILSVIELSYFQWFLLVFCCLNTLIAYGCFAEALEHWEASRVAAILAITPLFTLVFAYFTDQLFPSYLELENLNLVSICGAIILVGGSLITALSKKNKLV